MRSQRINKKDMSALWKDIFHDADDYISIIFDESFDNDFVATAYDGDLLTSMVIGVPYAFTSEIETFRGLYLCGVSTRAEYRGRGEIQRLMSQIEQHAAARGFDFLFLIPANERLRAYYSNLGYKNAVERMTGLYDIILREFCFDNDKNFTFSKNEILNIVLVDDLEISNIDLRKNILNIGENILSKLYEMETINARILCKNNYVVCRHKSTDWIRVIIESLVSNNIIKIYYENIVSESLESHIYKIKDIELINEDGSIKLSTKICNSEVASRLMKKKMNGVGMDTISPEHPCLEKYGMIKPLSRRAPRPEDVVINFLLD